MSATNSFAVVAESSRLGRQLLKKILEPLVTVDILAATDSIADAFSGDSKPTLLLISYDWPDIEAELDQLQQLATPVHVVILTSPDQHETGALEDQRLGVVGSITKPYQARDVTQYLVRALQDAVQKTSPQTHTTPDHALPLSIMLERDLAFCKRHGLMLSAMAVQINEHESLCAEIGRAAVNNAQTSLEKKMRALLRHEDSICLRQSGLIVLSLPGTPPLGARVLAHRLCAWIGQEEFNDQHFNIHFSVNIGIHCCVPGTEIDTLDFLLTTTNTAHEVPENGENHIHLSDYASAITGAKTNSSHDKRRPGSEHFWHTFEALLHHPDLNDSEHQDALLSRLGPILSNLSEEQRMILIDQLLVASVSPNG